MIEADPKSECAHLLLVVIKNYEVTIDSIVLGDQVEQGHTHVTQSEEVLTLHLAIE